MEQTTGAVDSTIDTLVKAIDHVPTLLLQDVADVIDDRQSVLASLPLVVLEFRLAYKLGWKGRPMSLLFAAKRRVKRM